MIISSMFCTDNKDNSLSASECGRMVIGCLTKIKSMYKGITSGYVKKFGFYRYFNGRLCLVAYGVKIIASSSVFSIRNLAD